jgi:hypothetical protein
MGPSSCSSLRFGLAVPLVALAFAACQAPWAPLPEVGTHKLELRLPELPASWSDLPGFAFDVSWLDPGGVRRRVSVGPGATVEVEVARGAAQAILAVPRSHGRALLPAGALYPSSLSEEAAVPGAEIGEGAFAFPAGSDELRLDWFGGYAAEAARILEAAGLDPARFDLARLRREAAMRVADPWEVLQPVEVCRRLVAGSFRADAFREGRRWQVSLPGPGPWAPESPLAVAPLPAALPSGGSAPWSADLAEGIHRFVGETGELVVAVDGAGSAVSVRVPSFPG